MTSVRQSDPTENQPVIMLPERVFDCKLALVNFLGIIASRVDARCASIVRNRTALASNDALSDHNIILDSLTDKSSNDLAAGKCICDTPLLNGEAVSVVGQRLNVIISGTNDPVVLLIFASPNCPSPTSWFTQVQQWLTTNISRASCVVDALLSNVKFSNERHLANFSNDTGELANSNVVNSIHGLFEALLLKRNRRNPADDKWDNGGSRSFKQQLEHFVTNKRSILFVLPGFPYKSTNTKDKVLGSLPDMAERVALQNLDKFLKAVKEVYEPGAYLIIFSDGRIYCDLVPIEDETVLRFSAAVRQLYQSNLIFWSDLNQFYPGLSHDDKRLALETLFGPGEKEVTKRIATDKDFAEVHQGFLNFGKVERTDVIRQCGELETVAHRRMLRNYAYGIMIKCFFAEHIRFSIHPSTNSEKFSINLVGDTDWETPWHCCAVMHADGSWTLAHRSFCEQNGYQLCTSEDGLPYFLAAQ